MPRFYVKNDKGLWNIYSTIIDDYLWVEFVEFDEVKTYVIGEAVMDKIKELDTLLTNKPRLNVMSYEEAEQRRADMRGEDNDSER